jgi:predicted transport protein
MGGGYQPQQPIYAQPPVYGVPPVYVTGQPNQNGDQNGDNSNGEQKPVNGQQPVIVYYANQPAQQGTPLLGTGDFDALVDKVLAAIVPAVQQRQVNANTDNVTASTDKPEQPKQSDTYIYNNNTAPATSGVDDVAKAILDQQSKVMDQQTKMLEQQAALIEELKKKALTDPEDEDEWSDEDEEEDFYDTDIEDEDQEQVPENKRVRIPSNFRVRLKASSDKCKTFYTELKNGLNSYKGFTFRMSGRLEKVNYHGETILMIGVVRKALKLWLALDPNAYDFERYHQKDVSDKKRYEHVPMQVRIGSARALKRAEELLDRLLENHQAESKLRYKPKNLQELAYTLKLNKLVKEKRNPLLCQSIHVHDADVLTDEDADRYLELRERAPIEDENFAVVSLDTLEKEFLDGNKVTLDRLKKKGLVPEECNGYYLTAGKRLSKPLYVIADDMSPSAVKMIVLTGGRAIKLVVPQTEAE